MITRSGLADEIDGFDVQIKALNDAKSAAYKAYREQLEDAGMEPRRASAEVAATKAAIAKRRKLRENPDAAREKDDMIDAILVEIMERPSRAREAGQSYAEVKGADPKLIETVVKGVQTEIGRKALVTALDAMIEAEEVTGEITEHEQPEIPANVIHERPSTNDKAYLEAVPQDEASLAGTGSRMLADREGRSEGEAASADLPTNSNPPAPNSQALADKTEAVSSHSVSVALSDDDVPTFLKKDKPLKTAADYRPHCQHPEACGSSGLHHCYQCQKAIASEAVPA